MFRKLLFSVLLALTALLMPCFFGEKVVYDSGRDTFRTFGDGRFQLCYPENYGYSFVDARNDPSVCCDHVIDWLERSGNIYLIGSHGERHVVDMRTATRIEYQGTELVPEAQREVFRSMEARTKIRRFVDDFGIALAWLLVDLLVLIGLVSVWISHFRRTGLK